MITYKNCEGGTIEPWVRFINAAIPVGQPIAKFACVSPHFLTRCMLWVLSSALGLLLSLPWARLLPLHRFLNLRKYLANNIRLSGRVCCPDPVGTPVAKFSSVSPYFLEPRVLWVSGSVLGLLLSLPWVRLLPLHRFQHLRNIWHTMLIFWARLLP